MSKHKEKKTISIIIGHILNVLWRIVFVVSMIGSD